MKKVNHREKNKKIAVSIITCLFLMIVSISIAYAALSETLTISGSGKVTATDWDISISPSTGNKVTGTATYTTPTVNGTTISYSLNLKKPGDSVTLYFRVNNAGDINGEVKSIVNSTPTCTSSTGNTQDANLICSNLDVSIAYETGTDISVGDVINTNSYTCYKNQTTAYDAAIIRVDISLKDSMTSVPTSDVTISNMKHDIIYGQTDKSCYTNTSCFVEGTKVLTEHGAKPIEEIEAGEYVYTMNLDTNKKELKKVLRKINSITDTLYEITVGDQLIQTTAKHEFYIIDKEWVRAADLIVGDKLSSEADIDTTITKIEVKKLKEFIPVYNMETEEHHNYLITEDKLLVHNATGSQ